MLRCRLCLFIVISSLLLVSAGSVAAADEQDVEGYEDHPLFTRMTNMRIVMCKTLPFDSFKFKTGKTTDETVEGRRFDIKYQIIQGNEYPGPLAIIRNHQQAIQAIGGSVLYEDQRYTWLRVVKDDKEIWAQVDTAWNKGYLLTIIEKQAMVQEVVASAEVFKSGLNTSGHVEVPGIYFDTGKSMLKPESQQAIGEIARLLSTDPGLKVYIVGHTDNTASLDLNQSLSQARAEAVLESLVSGHGIARDRLIARGVGPLAPVASNESEEGRSRNRRVELVKR